MQEFGINQDYLLITYFNKFLSKKKSVIQARVLGLHAQLLIHLIIKLFGWSGKKYFGAQGKGLRKCLTISVLEVQYNTVAVRCKIIHFRFFLSINCKINLSCPLYLLYSSSQTCGLVIEKTDGQNLYI